MNLYFIKATYTNNIYKLSDFYSGTDTIKNPNRMLSVNFKADEITTGTPINQKLPDGTDVRDYTHVIVPEYNMIYLITSVEYLNTSQYKIKLLEEPFIGNYQELKSKNIMMTRSNDERHFVGLHDIKDTAIEHKAVISNFNFPPTNTTGTWVMFTFQGDIEDLMFEIGELQDYPTLGSFSSLSSLYAAYPNVTTTTPYTVDYYLKFADVGTRLHQAVYRNGQVIWTEVNAYPDYSFIASGNPEIKVNQVKPISWYKTNNSFGDIATTSVVFPIDASLVVQELFKWDGENYLKYLSVPSYYSIRSWNNVGKLMNIKLVPEDLISEMNAFSVSNINTKVVRSLDYNNSNIFVESQTYNAKLFSSKYVSDLYSSSFSSNINYSLPSLPVYLVISLRSEFSFSTANITSSLDYEPFKKHYLYFFGEMIDIPSRYVRGTIKARLVTTSTDVLYEIYTDKMNIIASGRLMWFAKFSVDQLALFYANNPSYKDQYWTGHMVNAIKSTGMGALGGAIKGGPVGAAVGAGMGALNGAINLATAGINEHYREKGLKDKADQIFGQNDTALTNIKGFTSYLVSIIPETKVLEQMKNNYQLIGFPTNIVKSISDLNYQTSTLFGQSKIIQGNLYDIVKNDQITRRINEILKQGVILIP